MYKTKRELFLKFIEFYEPVFDLCEHAEAYYVYCSEQTCNDCKIYNLCYKAHGTIIHKEHKDELCKEFPEYFV